MQASRGVLLITFGSNAYAMQASNLAFMIKAVMPDLPITVYTDGNIKILDEYYRSCFDAIEKLPEES